MRSLLPLLFLMVRQWVSAFTLKQKAISCSFQSRGDLAALFVTRPVASIPTPRTRTSSDDLPAADSLPRIAKRRYHPNYEKSRYSATKMRLRSPNIGKPSMPVSEFLSSLPADGQSMTIDQIIHLAKHGAADSALAAFQNLLSLSSDNSIKIKLTTSEVATVATTLPVKNKIRVNVVAPLRQCNMLIKELADAGHFNQCAGVLTAMQTAGVRPSIVTYSTLISRAGAWQKVSVAEKYFHQMKHDGIKADVQAYNSLINAYAKEGETDRALSVLAEMDREYVKPTVVTFNTLIDSCARKGEVQKAEEMLQLMKERRLFPDERSYSSIVHAHCQSGKPESALLLVKKMEEEGLRPSSYTYSALLHGLGRAGYLDKAFDILNKMKAQGMRPNVVTMSSLMDACGKHDQIDLALSLYREMLRADGAENKPNSITCSALVDACLKVGQVERAFAIVQDMHARKLALTEVTYTSLITELTRLKQLDRIMDIVVSPTQGTAGTMKTFSGGSGGGGPSAPAKYSSSSSNPSQNSSAVAAAARRTRGNRVNTDVFPMSARTLSSSTVAEETTTERDPLPASTSASVRPRQLSSQIAPINTRTTATTFTTASNAPTTTTTTTGVGAIIAAAADGTVLDYAGTMEMFRSKRDHGSVVAVYEAMKSNGVKPSAREYRTLMSSLYEDQLRRAAEAEKQNPTPVPAPANNNLLADSSNSALSSSSSSFLRKDSLPSSVNEKSKQMKHNELFRLYLVFQEMRATGVQADAATYNTLINACAGVGDLEKALETVQTMQEDGIAPDIITYTSLMKACSINGGDGTVTLAEEIFAQMQQPTNHFSSYIEPNEFTFQWLIQTHLRAAVHGSVNTRRIWDLLDDMIRRGIKPGVSTYRSCVRAAVADGNVDRCLAMLIVIRNSTRMRFDFKSWQIAANLMAAKGLHEEEFKIKREIEEKKKEVAALIGGGSNYSSTI